MATKKPLPQRGTGLRTGRAEPKRTGKPRTEAERQKRHQKISKK